MRGLEVTTNDDSNYTFLMVLTISRSKETKTNVKKCHILEMPDIRSMTIILHLLLSTVFTSLLSIVTIIFAIGTVILKRSHNFINTDTHKQL